MPAGTVQYTSDDRSSNIECLIKSKLMPRFKYVASFIVIIRVYIEAMPLRLLSNKKLTRHFCVLYLG